MTNYATGFFISSGQVRICKGKNENMKIGIYLAYMPHLKSFSLKQEGLGRYMAAIIKSFINNGNEVTIACPKWSVYTVCDLLESENIDQDKVEFLYPKTLPVVLSLYLNKMEPKIKKDKKWKRKIKKSLLNTLDNLVLSIFMIKSFLLSFFIFVAGVLLLIVFSPILIALTVISGFLHVISTIYNKLSIKTFNHFRYNSLFKRIYLRFKRQLSFGEVMEKMRMDCAKLIIKNIKGMKNPVDLWYCPMAFWPEFNLIKGTKIICAPDLVTTEFPINFSPLNVAESTKNVSRTIEQGTYFITYCEYLKKTLLIDKYNKKEENIVAIPHAVNETANFIKFSVSDKAPYFSDIMHEYAKNILNKMVHQSAEMKDYLTGTGEGGTFDFSDIKYIFYASQARGSKNMLSLIQAYEYMLRERNIPVKLILTCNLRAIPSLYQYVYDRTLQYDILTFHGCSNQQLAALYKCAQLSVNPTLYEGGFPFTFGEGMSVGTPSVMGKIPQVLDVVEGYDFKNCLFNPYDYKDIAEKIIYGLNHREELLKSQYPLYEKMMERTWKEVGKEYMKAFKYFYNKDQKEKEAI